jgi:hypothetical protein
MATRVEQVAEQVKSLPLSEREELLAWLADFELGQVDAWDEEMARDSQPGGRMQHVLIAFAAISPREGRNRLAKSLITSDF